MSRRLVVFLITLLAGCTPLGVWVYEEPRIGLQDVLVDTSTSANALPPYVILSVRNRNDYELSLRRVELVLRVDGQDVGTAALDTIVTVEPIMNRPVRLPVPPLSPEARRRIAATGRGVHSYGIAGRARFDTPIGERRIGFEGELRGSAEPAAE